MAIFWAANNPAGPAPTTNTVFISFLLHSINGRSLGVSRLESPGDSIPFPRETRRGSRSPLNQLVPAIAVFHVNGCADELCPFIDTGRAINMRGRTRNSLSTIVFTRLSNVVNRIGQSSPIQLNLISRYS